MVRSLIRTVGLPTLVFALIVAPITFSAQDTAKTQSPTPDATTIFTSAKCGTCHYVSTLDLGKKPVEGKANTAPDLAELDSVPDTTFIVKYLKREEELHGKKHLQAFKGPDAQLDSLARWIVALNTEDTAGAKE